MTPLDVAIRRVLDGPKGPGIGAFFDFDGTLIDGYSAADYFADRLKHREITFREIVETLSLGWKGDPTDAEFGEIIGKGILEWAGQTEEEVRALWKRLWLEKIAATLFPEGWQLVQAHRRMGHTVAVASSATPYQIEPLAEEYGIDHVVATQARIRNGRLTGGITGKPAWGEGKAQAVRAFAKRERIDLARSYGYANGNEDIAFLKSVGHATAVQPRDDLERIANESGWPILRFAPRARGSIGAMARTVGAYGAMGATFLAGLAYAKATGRTRRAADLITSISSDVALAVLGIDVEVQGEQHLWAHRPCVFIINHQSKLDMFVMMSLIRRDFVGVAKSEAANTPGFGTYMKMADFAFLDRTHTDRAIEALKPAVERLRRGFCVCIAPEGTRSYTPRVGRFKKGAFHMAMQAGVPVVPVVLRNAGEIMGRNDQTMRSGTLQVAVLPPLDTSTWRGEDMDSRVENVRQLYIDTLQNWPERSKRGARVRA